MRYTQEALVQVEQLAQHYQRLGRPEAIRNLDVALSEAERVILADPEAGLQAPRPYPTLRTLGRLWIKAGPYWIAYDRTVEPTIMGVFYERANTPRRL